MLKNPFQARLPKYQRFHIEPRFYDPIKEDLHTRKMIIQREIAKENFREQQGESFIEDSFRRRAVEKRKTSALQLVLMIGLLVFAVYYLYF